MGLDTSEALESDAWLNISSDSVQEFLQFECLNVVEADLLTALIKWGKSQLQQDEADDGYMKSLREKILPGLQKIRFESLTHEEFTQLCQKELGAVLSGDEKCSIYMSITTGVWTLSEVAPSKLNLRNGPYILCNAIFERHEPRDADNRTQINSCLKFSVCETALFAGLKINLKEYYHENMIVDLYDDRETKIGHGNSKFMEKSQGVAFCKITPFCTLAPNVTYELRIDLTNSYHKRAYHRTKYHTYFNEGNRLEIKSEMLCAAVVALVFKRNI